MKSPVFARAMAVARPMPPVAPVMRASLRLVLEAMVVVVELSFLKSWEGRYIDNETDEGQKDTSVIHLRLNLFTVLTFI